MIEVIDNFLPQESFDGLSKFLLPAMSVEEEVHQEACLWKLSRVVDNPNTKSNNLQLVHDFTVLPTIERIEKAFCGPLNIVTLLRAKANITFNSPHLLEHGMHVDVEGIDHVPVKTGILYLNTCDGYTLFENGRIIRSVANRYVEFDCSIRHTGTTTTDQPYRAVINLNYIPHNYFPVVNKNRY